MVEVLSRVLVSSSQVENVLKMYYPQGTIIREAFVQGAIVQRVIIQGEIVWEAVFLGAIFLRGNCSGSNFPRVQLSLGAIDWEGEVVRIPFYLYYFPSYGIS